MTIPWKALNRDESARESNADALRRFLDQLGERIGRPRIRCPKCRWQPSRTSRWYCRCGHAWNTFDTRGRCPSCGYQWRDTACHSCHEWSAHDAWYEEAPAAQA